MRDITLHAGQQPFVFAGKRYPFYIGGIGSGKTFSGCTRGLHWSQQPTAHDRLYGPRGCILATNKPVLKDVVIPEFMEVEYGSGLLKSYAKSDMIAYLHTTECRKPLKSGNCCKDALVLFRSLDNPEWRRGLNLSWFFIDEGRHIGLDAFNILVGRLRQPGYEHSGWTTSTPNGFDWMWQLSNEDSPFRIEDAEWVQASTLDNFDNLPADFIADLRRTYKEGSPLWRQEVMGEFVGLMKGAVFEEFDVVNHIQDFEYDPKLPLYSGWDFGIGDLGVVVFVQVDELTEITPEGVTIHKPELRIIGYMEAPNRNAGQWARAYFDWCRDNTSGRLPDANYGDPAGRQRGATGTSWMDELRSHGVRVIPVNQRPRDAAIHVIRTAMADDRVLVRKDEVDKANNDSTVRFGQALASHRWNVDDQGNRIGKEPIHDWTSHGCAALGYLVIGRPELSHTIRRTAMTLPAPHPDSWKELRRNILNEKTGPQPLGPSREPDVIWTPTPAGHPDFDVDADRRRWTKESSAIS